MERFTITKKTHTNLNQGSAKAKVVSEKLLQSSGEQKCDFKHSTTIALEKQKVKIVTRNPRRLVMFSLGIIWTFQSSILVLLEVFFLIPGIFVCLSILRAKTNYCL